MKQLIISKGTYITATDYTSLTTKDAVTNITDGAIGLFYLGDGSKITSALDIKKGNFTVVCGRGEDKMPINFPEVDVKTLTVSTATYSEGKNFTAELTIPATEKGKHYTIVVVKKGTVFNERSNWTFTTMAKDTTAANVAEYLAARVNDNAHSLGLKATVSGAKITLTAVEKGKDYNVVGADELLGTTVTIKAATKAVLDKAYVQDLASRCAAGKGFNYLGEDGKEIYPGYPEVVDSDKYVLYTLRFAVPRVGAKQRDEVVYQLLHIVMPVGSDAITTLDTIFGITRETNSETEEASESGSVTGKTSNLDDDTI